MPFKWKWRFQSNYCLPDGELNPGLPRDRRGYWPLYYRGHVPLPGIEPEPPEWKPGILATRPCGMCRNPGPLDLQFNDLPTELFRHTLSTLSRSARLHAGANIFIFNNSQYHMYVAHWPSMILAYGARDNRFGSRINTSLNEFFIKWGCSSDVWAIA